jgi:hypothetical protein
MEAKCAKCGVSVVITRVGLGATDTSYEMKPGLPLDDLCPVIIERKEAGKPPTQEACPNLHAAINARIEQLRTEQS